MTMLAQTYGLDTTWRTMLADRHPVPDEVPYRYPRLGLRPLARGSSDRKDPSIDGRPSLYFEYDQLEYDIADGDLVTVSDRTSLRDLVDSDERAVLRSQILDRDAVSSEVDGRVPP